MTKMYIISSSERVFADGAEEAEVFLRLSRAFGRSVGFIAGPVSLEGTVGTGVDHEEAVIGYSYTPPPPEQSSNGVAFVGRSTYSLNVDYIRTLEAEENSPPT